MELIIGFVILFWIGVKLNRWINGSSKIANNQRKIIEELRKQNQAKKSHQLFLLLILIFI